MDYVELLETAILIFANVIQGIGVFNHIWTSRLDLRVEKAGLGCYGTVRRSGWPLREPSVKARILAVHAKLVR